MQFQSLNSLWILTFIQSEIPNRTHFLHLVIHFHLGRKHQYRHIWGHMQLYCTPLPCWSGWRVREVTDCFYVESSVLESPANLVWQVCSLCLMLLHWERKWVLHCNTTGQKEMIFFRIRICTRSSSDFQSSRIVTALQSYTHV